MEFEIKGITYKAAKLDAFKQLHLSRKIAPVIPTLIPLYMAISKDADVKDDLDTLAKMLQPFADAIAGLSNDSTEYIMETCLSVVKRNQDGAWHAVWNVPGKVAMYDEDIGTLLQICLKVIQDSLGAFIQGLLMSQQDNPATTE
jgi:hypothetical protein